MSTFSRIRKITGKILNISILVLFLAMFGVTTLNVFMRYVMNRPLSFAVEFGRYTFISIVYLGSILVMRDDGHIGLDIIVNMLPESVAKVIKIFTRVLVILYLCLFLNKAGIMVMTNWANKSSTMQIPMSIVYMAMVIGGAGMIIEEILIIFGLNQGESDVTESGGGM